MRIVALVLVTLLAFARRRPWEPLLIIFSIMVACAGLTAVSLINDSAGSNNPPTDNSWTRPYLTITATSPSQPLRRSDYALLRRAGFDEIVAVTRAEASVGCEAQTTHPLNIVGIDSVGAFSHHRTNGKRQSSTPVSDQVSSGIALSSATLALLGCSGNALTLADSTLPPATLLGSVPYGVVLMDIDVFYSLFSLKQTPLSELIVADPMTAPRLATLNDFLPAHLQVNVLPRLAGHNEMSESFQLNLWAMGALMAIVSLFIVINALNLMYRARLPSLVRLRQTGVSTLHLSLALAVELVMYTGIACLLGVTLGAWLTLTFTPAIASTFTSLFSLDYVQAQPVFLDLFIQAWLLSMLALSMFLIVPVLRLSRLLTFKASLSRNALPLWPGLLALGIALIAPAFAFDTVSALAVVGVSLVCGCLCILSWLPPLLATLARHVPRRMPLLHYSTASAVQLSHRTRMAVCAFFTALSANIAMNVMTDSFRQATYDLVENRLSADAYLYNVDSPRQLPAPASVTLTPVYRSDIQIDSMPARARSYPSTFRAKQGLVTDSIAPDAWTLFADDEGVFINQQLAFRRALSLGDSIDITFTAGIKDNYRVVGIYPDYGNPDSQALVSIDRLATASNFSGVVSVEFMPSMSAKTIADWRSSLPDDIDYYSSSELLTLSMKAFEQTFTVTRALNIATLSVAALSFLLAMITVSLDIRPQLSLLRSLGLSSLAIHLALFSQYVLLCTGTALLALPAGIALSWVFIYRVNRYAFDWVYPLSVDPGVLLSSALYSVAAMLIVLLIPLSRLRARVDLRQEVTL